MVQLFENSPCHINMIYYYKIPVKSAQYTKILTKRVCVQIKSSCNTNKY